MPSRMWRSKVVFPEPRKPDRRVTGSLGLSSILADIAGALSFFAFLSRSGPTGFSRQIFRFICQGVCRLRARDFRRRPAHRSIYRIRICSPLDDARLPRPSSALVSRIHCDLPREFAKTLFRGAYTVRLVPLCCTKAARVQSFIWYR